MIIKTKNKKTFINFKRDVVLTVLVLFLMLFSAIAGATVGVVYGLEKGATTTLDACVSLGLKFMNAAGYETEGLAVLIREAIARYGLSVGASVLFDPSSPFPLEIAKNETARQNSFP